MIFMLHIGNLLTLADFYHVSTDYLLCRTELREHTNKSVSDLHLNDDAVQILTFHVQSTAQLNYLLSTIVYVPDSKFTFNVANALLYSHRICRELSPPEIATSAPSENALWVFRMRINASCF